MYRNIDIDAPCADDRTGGAENLPYAVSAMLSRSNLYTEAHMLEAKRAFYVLCTQIDHQIRYLVGTLRLEGLLDDIVVMFTSDHGDMSGNHGIVARRTF